MTPATVYDATAVVFPKGDEASDHDPSLDAPDQWLGERMMIVVRFDDAGEVRTAFGIRPSPPAWYRTLRRWLLLPA